MNATNFHGTSFIGYQRGAQHGKSQQAFNPATGQALPWQYFHCSDTEREKALALADAAFIPFQNSRPEQRAELLEAIANNLAAQESLIIDIATQETGLPSVRIKNELARTCFQLRHFATLIREGKCFDKRIDAADNARTPPKPELRAVKLAVGPVTVFGASNFPLAFSVAGGDTASALAAGCPVIVKAHSLHPFTAEIVAGVISATLKQQGWPEGVFSMLYGAGTETGKALVQDARIKAVGFTGSESGGRALQRYASERQHPIPVFAEMSSLNPVFLFPHALDELSDEIAGALAASICNGVGQFCTKPGLLIAPRGVALDRCLEKLNALLTAQQPAPMLSQQGAKHFATAITAVKAHANTVTHEGKVEAAYASPFLLTVDAQAFMKRPELQTEMFGPAALVIVADHETQFGDISNVLNGQLTATVWQTEHDAEAVANLLPRIQNNAGRIVFNGVPTGVEVSHAMVHGGPSPATSDARFTSVGAMAIDRFLRPVCFQNTPTHLLPEILRDK
ncbi:aldehyde dehydrogenase (NADP(+)) [Permianibacter aggregans]|uniref:NADP-dependent aldehyde dehydrogenase n=1 Tax=Permianibacter aggregans TaxID=1510150 RepID=A0A4R6UKI7_9GAMM|nr:aldehyde dehydrogenase (NADP(+)) [Permianibacter aggregans]QGX41227.1 aldehyde dehydrogenase (NADP(+)) [Permianibacter aggregans]TDQ45833.1 NADP-dependent aldehyde dehydrogenase [Permianibacter aggregans]